MKVVTENQHLHYENPLNFNASLYLIANKMEAAFNDIKLVLKTVQVMICTKLNFVESQTQLICKISRERNYKMLNPSYSYIFLIVPPPCR